MQFLYRDPGIGSQAFCSPDGEKVSGTEVSGPAGSADPYPGRENRAGEIQQPGGGERYTGFLAGSEVDHAGGILYGSEDAITVPSFIAISSSLNSLHICIAKALSTLGFPKTALFCTIYFAPAFPSSSG